MTLYERCKLALALVYVYAHPMLKLGAVRRMIDEQSEPRTNIEYPRLVVLKNEGDGELFRFVTHELGHATSKNEVVLWQSVPETAPLGALLDEVMAKLERS